LGERNGLLHQFGHHVVVLSGKVLEEFDKLIPNDGYFISKGGEALD
jgi:hypothetical protein